MGDFKKIVQRGHPPLNYAIVDDSQDDNQLLYFWVDGGIKMRTNIRSGSMTGGVQSYYQPFGWVQGLAPSDDWQEMSPHDASDQSYLYGFQYLQRDNVPESSLQSALELYDSVTTSGGYWDHRGAPACS